MKGGYDYPDKANPNKAKGNGKKLTSSEKKRAKTSKLVKNLHSTPRRYRKSRRSRGRK